MEASREFGVKLRDLRIQSNMTQRRLASMLGVDFSYLSKIENGVLPPPSEKVLRKLSSILGMDIDELEISAGRVPGDIIQIMSQKNRSDFGVMIRDRRLKLGLTQVNIAKHVGITSTYLSKIENSVMPPPAEKVVLKLAEALNIKNDIMLNAAGKIRIRGIKEIRKLRARSESQGIEAQLKLGIFKILMGVRILPEEIIHNRFARVAIATVMVALISISLWFAAPTTPSAVSANNQGVEYNQEGEFQKAIGEFDKAIEINPALAEAYNNRGWAYIELEQYEQGIADCTKAIELDPALALAHSNRGWAYINLGEYKQAATDCSKAIELDPYLALAYLNRGKAYIELGRYEEAIADLERAMELDPTLNNK
jgi:transcriptional regulator with XRE-family HTH domain